MTTVRVLVDSVGGYNAGDIVKDAPEGLVDIANRKVCNAATGQRLAELIDSDEAVTGDQSELIAKLEQDLADAQARETALQEQLEGYISRETELLEQIASFQADDELKELKATAKEMKIPGYTKMDAEELKAAISAAGSDGNGE